MNRRSAAHPRITPLRALALLRRLERAGSTPPAHLLDELRDALGHHVAAGLVQRRHCTRKAAP